MPEVWEIQDARTGETFEIESDHQPTPDEAKTAMAKYRVTTARASGKPMMGAAPPSGGQKFLNQLTQAMGPTTDSLKRGEMPPNPIGPKAREMLTSPLVHPTGIDAVDAISSPLNLMMGAGAGVAGAMRPAAGIAGRAIGAARGVAGGAGPIIKYEVVHTALKSVGVPDWLATIAAGTIAAHGGGKVTAGAPGGAPVAAEVPARVETPLERTARAKAEYRAANGIPADAKHPGPPESVQPPTSPGGSASGGTAPPASPPTSPKPATAPTEGLPDQKALNEQAIARRRAEYQQRQQAQGGQADEAYARLRAQGKTDEQARAALVQAQQLADQLGVKTPTVAETKFPKGMRGKKPVSTEANPPAKEYASTENPTSPVQREVENASRKTAGTKGAKIADSQAGADSLEVLQDAIHGPDAPTKGNGTYGKKPVKAEADIDFPKVPSPSEIRETRRIIHELDAMPYTDRLLKPSDKGNTLEHVPGTGGAGAKVYDDIMQMAPGTSKITRGKLQKELEAYLAGGKMTNAVKGAIEIAKLRASGAKRIPGDGPLSSPELPPSAGDVPTRLEKK